jgi:rhodanese-related sulfurtransferase
MSAELIRPLPVTGLSVKDRRRESTVCFITYARTAMSSPADPIEVSVAEVKGLLDAGAEFLFVDCREPHEQAIAAIEGTQLLPMSALAERIGELAGQEERRIVVHCHHGGRSLRAANWLRQQGFGRAQSMAGGIDQWATEVEPGMARY